MTDLTNFDAEQAVIGGILMRPEAMVDVADWLRAEMFSDSRTRWVYTAMQSLWQKRQPADHLTIPAELVMLGAKSEANAMLFLQECKDVAGYSPYVEHHAEIVRDMAERRAIEQAGSDLVKAAHAEAELNTDDLIITARRRIESFQRTRVTPETMEQQIDFIRQRSLDIWSGRYIDRVVPSGIGELDRILSGGFRPAELTILGAKQSMGKTATMLRIARKKPWLVFSLEMTTEAINRRFIATEAGVSFDVAFRTPNDVKLQDRWLEASDAVAQWPTMVIGEPGMTTMRMEAMAERTMQEREVCGVMIDHTGHVTDSIPGSLYEKTSEVAKRIKHMAGRLNLPVLALQQLNREVERRSTCMPTMSDLSDSGKWEQVADVVALLFRRNYYVSKGILEADTDQDYIRIGDKWNLERLKVKVEKNRNGDTGVVDLGWDGMSMRLVEAV